MTKRKETVSQLLERVRGEMGVSIEAFAEKLQISRQWYYQILNDEKEVPLKILSFLAIDHQGEALGSLASELIVRWHGKPFLPIGSRDELFSLAGFMESASFEELRTMANNLADGHFGIWAAEMIERLKKQLNDVKVENRSEVVS